MNAKELDTNKIKVPDWATWVAQDCLGNWWAFEFVPVIDSLGCWSAPDGDFKEIGEGSIDVPWQRTLQRVNNI